MKEAGKVQTATVAFAQASNVIDVSITHATDHVCRIRDRTSLLLHQTESMLLQDTVEFDAETEIGPYRASLGCSRRLAVRGFTTNSKGREKCYTKPASGQSCRHKNLGPKTDARRRHRTSADPPARPFPWQGSGLPDDHRQAGCGHTCPGSAHCPSCN